jgi:integrase
MYEKKVRFQFKTTKRVSPDLKKTDVGDYGQIIISMTLDHGRIRYYPGFTVKREEWDEENGSFIGRKLSSQNAKLRVYEKRAKEKVDELRELMQPVTVADIRKVFDEIKNPSTKAEVPKEKEKTILQLYHDYVFEKRDGSVKGSKSVYKNSYNRYKEYCDTKNREIVFSEFDKTHYNGFVEFLRSKTIKDKYKYKPSQINKLAANFITFVRHLEESGALGSITYSHLMKAPERGDDIQRLYLTIDELTKLKNCSGFSKNKEKVRDAFLVACFTGLRYGDLKALSKSSIESKHGIRLIVKQTEKTRKQVYIPIHEEVEAILGKYEGNFPKPVSNQKMNKYIKEICQIAGINDLIEMTVYLADGSKPIVKTEKYNLITMHTARRSFATNLYNGDVDKTRIMNMTGHTTEKEFSKYLIVEGDKNAKAVYDSSGFKNMSLTPPRTGDGQLTPPSP